MEISPYLPFFYIYFMKISDIDYYHTDLIPEFSLIKIFVNSMKIRCGCSDMIDLAFG